jgi:type 1 fimbriae regulatory protein FimB
MATARRQPKKNKRVMSASGKVIKYLTRAEIEMFFRQVKGLRDRAIFRLAYHRGLRASEVALLQLGDWDPKEGVLVVHRLKGSVSAPFHLLPVEATALRAWLRVRGTTPGPIFLSRNHRGISRWALDELMKRYAKAAGISPVKAHMHALKHSCGTHLAEMDEPVVIIQDWLGHRNIANTMVYVEVTNKARQAATARLRNWK